MAFKMLSSMSITVLQDKQGLEDEQGDKEIRVLRIYKTVK